MNEYDYKGYIITENLAGNYEVNGCEFPSLDEAMDWVDDIKSTEEPAEQHIYYVSYLIDKGNSHSEDYIWAYDSRDAIRRIKMQNPDLHRVLQCYRTE